MKEIALLIDVIFQTVPLDFVVKGGAAATGRSSPPGQGSGGCNATKTAVATVSVAAAATTAPPAAGEPTELMSVETVKGICEHLRRMATEARHRGAFDTIAIGLVTLSLTPHI
jgi:hypothetical protein